MTTYRVLMEDLGSSRHVIGLSRIGHLGLTPSDVRRLSRLGVLEPLGLATYGLVGVEMTPDRHLWTAVVAARESCPDPALVAAARTSAAWLWGMLRRAPTTSRIVVPSTTTPELRLAAVRVHRSRTLTTDQIEVVQDIPATIPTRTITDATMNLAVPAIMELVARGLHLGLFELPDLSSQLRRAGRIRGAPRLRLALRRLDPDVARAESRAEAVALDALATAGLPAEPQVEVATPDGRFRIDLALRDHRVAIEIDGYWWHFTPAQKRRDARRQNALVAAGWRVLRFGADEVLTDPIALVTASRAMLG